MRQKQTGASLPAQVGLIVVCVLLVRLALYVTTITQTPGSPSFSQIFYAHDGREYLAFAEILQSSSAGPLPAEVVRHDPGLALLTVAASLLTGNLMPLKISTIIIQIASLVIGLLLALRLADRLRIPASDRLKAGLLIALGYPATVYYGLFHLTELPFAAFLLASLLSFARSRYWLAFGLAGLAALIRSTGLLLVISLALAHPAVISAARSRLPFHRGTIKTLWPVAGGLLLGICPWLLGQAGIHHFFESTVASHKPAFSWPFSGFVQMAAAGPVRIIYILACVSFFILSTGRWIVQSRREKWSHPLHNLIALFLLLFLGFHLCLKSLYYIDQTVYTFDYQDRYLAPLWPIAVLAWRRFLSWPLVLASAAFSLMISAWWLHNYLEAAVAR